MKKCPPQINFPQKIIENPYNCIDTGGFFIVGFKGKTIKIMDADKSGKSDDNDIITQVTAAINGRNNGLAERKIFTRKAKEVIGDEI